MRLSPRRRPPKASLLALVGGLAFAISPIGAGVVAATSSTYVANCTSNLRASASTSGSLVDSIAQGTTVTATVPRSAARTMPRAGWCPARRRPRARTAG